MVRVLQQGSWRGCRRALASSRVTLGCLPLRWLPLNPPPVCSRPPETPRRTATPPARPQMVLETKSSLEAGVVGAGHSFAGSRLDAQRSAAGWASEQMGGVAYLDYIRQLAARVDGDWEGVQADLQAIRCVRACVWPAGGLRREWGAGIRGAGSALLVWRRPTQAAGGSSSRRASRAAAPPPHPPLPGVAHASPLRAVCSKALLQRRGVLVNMTGDENTLRLATRECRLPRAPSSGAGRRAGRLCRRFRCCRRPAACPAALEAPPSRCAPGAQLSCLLLPLPRPPPRSLRGRLPRRPARGVGRGGGLDRAAGARQRGAAGAHPGQLRVQGRQPVRGRRVPGAWYRGTAGRTTSCIAGRAAGWDGAGRVGSGGRTGQHQPAAGLGRSPGSALTAPHPARSRARSCRARRT